MTTEVALGLLAASVTAAPFVMKLVFNGKYALREDVRALHEEMRSGFEEVRGDIKDLLRQI